MLGTQMMLSCSFPACGPLADLVVPKTVVSGWEAYALARAAPRPRVAPIMRTLGIFVIGWIGGSLIEKFRFETRLEVEERRKKCC